MSRLVSLPASFRFLTLFRSYQQRVYRLTPVVPVIDTIRNRRMILDQNELYEKSRVVEPPSKTGGGLRDSTIFTSS